jgi:AcrR family transcriptional regulator
MVQYRYFKPKIPYLKGLSTQATLDNVGSSVYLQATEPLPDGSVNQASVPCRMLISAGNSRVRRSLLGWRSVACARAAMAPLPKPSDMPNPEREAAVGHPDSPHQIFSTSQRDRLLSGAVQAVSEHGYPLTTVAQIISVPRISRRTFYEHFADKHDCMLAVYDRIVEWLGERVTAALTGIESWRRAVQVTVKTVLACLDADPRLARLCAVEVLSLGSAGVARHEDLIARLVLPQRAGRAHCPWGTELPLSLEETVVGGVLWLIGCRAQPGGGDSFGELGPEITYFLLAPYLGIRQARREAFGEPFLLSSVESG